MRYTIPGWASSHTRSVVEVRDMTGRERWRILLTADRLRGVGRNTARPAPVHRERVRFGAWEERPRVSASLPARHRVLAYAADRFGIDVETWQAVALGPMSLDLPRQNSAGVMARILAAETSGAQTGTGEGPSISGPQNAYKCEGER